MGEDEQEPEAGAHAVIVGETGGELRDEGKSIYTFVSYWQTVFLL